MRTPARFCKITANRIARRLRAGNAFISLVYHPVPPGIELGIIAKHLQGKPLHRGFYEPIKPSQLHKVLINIFVIQRSRESARATPGDEVAETKHLKILLAEDNTSSQKVALQILKRLGYKADVAANGIEVLQALERQPYDLVFMDIRMPEMNGLEATRIIRQRWPDNGPKIVAITAYALEGDKEKCIEAGMDDYISKPIRVNELAEVLKKYQTAEIP